MVTVSGGFDLGLEKKVLALAS